MNDLVSVLRALCEADGVVGCETNASEQAARFLSEWMDDVSIDAFGSVTAVKKSSKENAKTVLLDAHIDEIGMIVTGIDDKGFLRVSNCGGLDRRLFAAQPVAVHTKDGDLFGIVGTKPPHLLSDEEAKKVPKIEDLFLDIGYDADGAKQRVALGDRVTIRTPFSVLLGGRVSSKALDDRSGVAAILRALSLLNGEDCGVNVAVSFTAREETGGQGATTAAYRLAPDFAVAVDVCHAKTPDSTPNKSVPMGKGAAIAYSPVLDKRCSDALVRMAREQEIPYQIEAMGGRSTGTNADEMLTTRSGVRTAVVSIPERYMHTPVEVLDLADIESVAKLLAQFVREVGNDHV